MADHNDVHDGFWGLRQKQKSDPKEEEKIGGKTRGGLLKRFKPARALKNLNIKKALPYIPEVAVSAGAGMALRLGFKAAAIEVFAASLPVAVPAAAITIGATVFAGAASGFVIGGGMNAYRTYRSGHRAKEDLRDAFIKGAKKSAVRGLISGMVGFTVLAPLAHGVFSNPVVADFVAGKADFLKSITRPSVFQPVNNTTLEGPSPGFNHLPWLYNGTFGPHAGDIAPNATNNSIPVSASGLVNTNDPLSGRQSVAQSVADALYANTTVSENITHANGVPPVVLDHMTQGGGGTDSMITAVPPKSELVSLYDASHGHAVKACVTPAGKTIYVLPDDGHHHHHYSHDTGTEPGSGSQASDTAAQDADPKTNNAAVDKCPAADKSAKANVPPTCDTHKAHETSCKTKIQCFAVKKKICPPTPC
ncbi:MAG: hypothetical protein PHW76_05215 [Alphaproteobacteria bacterium]|nr:hypothetical protein [Alphaproteobacteria bacterium]